MGLGSLNLSMFYHRITQLKRALGNKKSQAMTSTDGGWEYCICDFILFIFVCLQNLSQKEIGKSEGNLRIGEGTACTLKLFV